VFVNFFIKLISRNTFWSSSLFF